MLKIILIALLVMMGFRGGCSKNKSINNSRQQINKFHAGSATEKPFLWLTMNQ
ncbi:MAG: hypothetical protein QM768_12910 [Agriterribacter sp.]